MVTSAIPIGARFRRAVEDDVFHLFAAEGFRALLAEYPGDGVGNIALAATVRADDRRDAGIVDGDLSLFRERFKPNHLDTSKFQHKCVFLKESAKLSDLKRVSWRTRTASVGPVTDWVHLRVVSQTE